MFCFLASNRKPLRHIESGNLINGENFTHARRCLDFFVLLVGLEGTLYIAQDHVPYTLSSGDFMLLLPGHVHEGYRPSDGMCSYFWCHFRVPEDFRLLDSPEAEAYLADCKAHGAPTDFYLLPEHGTFSNISCISLVFRQLIDISLQDMYSSAVADYAASLLVMHLTQEYLQQHTRRAVMTRSFCGMAELQEYIRLHYKEELSVPKLAKLFGYNANYLSTVYKKASGESLVHTINKTRIAAAKTLLLDTSDSVSAIAYRVGFSDSKYFIRVFRQLVNVTPAMFRTVYWRKHMNTE